jgi:hypothetical protein
MKRHTNYSYTSQQYDAKLPSDPPALADVVWLGDRWRFYRNSLRRSRETWAIPCIGSSLAKCRLTVSPCGRLAQVSTNCGTRTSVHGTAFYLKKIASVVYVLHCFEKRTAQTERKDIEVARERLKRLSEQHRAKEKRQIARPPDKGKRS